jgi:hypothetical protein
MKMSNHGYVTTKKHMTTDDINELFEDLNNTIFKGSLVVEQAGDCWEIKTNHKHSWGSRQCWLKSKRKFEIRHNASDEFIGWMDVVITNELACKFNGSISDDGVCQKWKGEHGKYPTFKDWVYALNPNPIARKFLYFDKKFIPKAHMF